MHKGTVLLGIGGLRLHLLLQLCECVNVQNMSDRNCACFGTSTSVAMSLSVSVSGKPLTRVCCALSGSMAPLASLTKMSLTIGGKSQMYFSFLSRAPRSHTLRGNAGPPEYHALNSVHAVSGTHWCVRLCSMSALSASGLSASVASGHAHCNAHELESTDTTHPAGHCCQSRPARALRALREHHRRRLCPTVCSASTHRTT